MVTQLECPRDRSGKKKLNSDKSKLMKKLTVTVLTPSASVRSMQGESAIVRIFSSDKSSLLSKKKIKMPTRLNFDADIRKGFKWEEGLQAKKRLGLKDAEFSGLIGISERTLSRHKTVGRMTPLASDRLYRIARIYAFAVEVFEDDYNAQRWLRREQIGLGGRVPFDLMQTEAGALEVENLLGRIEHGVFA